MNGDDHATRSKSKCPTKKFMKTGIQSQERNARVTINAVHPGIVKTGIIRAHKGLLTGKYKVHNFNTIWILFFFFPPFFSYAMRERQKQVLMDPTYKKQGCVFYLT